jgi:hypothetical protein
MIGTTTCGGMTKPFFALVSFAVSRVLSEP